jgi:hypothetical protein
MWYCPYAVEEGYCRRETSRRWRGARHRAGLGSRPGLVEDGAGRRAGRRSCVRRGRRSPSRALCSPGALRTVRSGGLGRTGSNYFVQLRHRDSAEPRCRETRGATPSAARARSFPPRTARTQRAPPKAALHRSAQARRSLVPAEETTPAARHDGRGSGRRAGARRRDDAQ